MYACKMLLTLCQADDGFCQIALVLFQRFPSRGFSNAGLFLNGLNIFW